MTIATSKTSEGIIKYFKKTFFSGVFKTLLVLISTIAFLPQIISNVGLERYGLVSLVMIFGGMTTFADFGVSKSVTYLLGQNSKKNINEIVSNALTINFISYCVLILCGLTIKYLNIDFFGEKSDIDRDVLQNIVVAGYMYVFLIILNNIYMAILESLFLAHMINFGFMLSSISLNFTLYFVSEYTKELTVLLYSPIISMVPVVLYFHYIVNKNIRIKLIPPKLKNLKSLMLLSLKFMNLSIINSLVIPINKYLLVYMTGNASLLAIFDISLKLAQIANSFLNSLTQPLFGIFSNKSYSVDEVFKISIKISSIIFIFYIVGNFLFKIIGLEIVSYIDEENKEKLLIISVVLMAGVTFSSISEPFYKALLGKKRLTEAFFLKLTTPIINVILLCLLYLIDPIKELENFSLAYSASVFLTSILIIIYYLYAHFRSDK